MAKHKSEGNSPDLDGGVERDVDSLHAWAEIASRLGSKLLEAFYVERLDAVLVQKSEDAEGVRYDFDEATRLGGAPLDVERLRRALETQAERAHDKALSTSDSYDRGYYLGIAHGLERAITALDREARRG